MSAFEMLSISSSRISSLVAPLVDESCDLDPLEIFCSLAWSSITEPGDAMAGLANLALGATDSLIALRNSIQKADRGQSLLQAIALANPNSDGLAKADLQERIAEAVDRWKPRFVLQVLVSELELARQIGARILIAADPAWPSQVNDLGLNKPIVLWLLGKAEARAVGERSIAFVGARNATDYGLATTEHLVSETVRQGFLIVSGAAQGIDAAAHEAALKSNTPNLAVMAGGLARLYPQQNLDLLARIQKSGFVISEQPPSREPTKWRFLQRNRLIAAISKATVVVEAGWRSGSINTANHASDLGRPIAAVPGQIFSQASRGCHELIRTQKATLIASSEDLFELVQPTKLAPTAGRLDLGQLEIRMLDALSTRAKTLDQLCVEAGMSLREVSVALAALEQAGLAKCDIRGWRR